MSTFNEGHKDWTEVYPVEERIGSDADTSPDAVLMVDVGGGYGHQTVKLKRKFPNLPGRFVVQDLLALPPEKTRVNDVEYMEHDFMTEQPVKGTYVVL